MPPSPSAWIVHKFGGTCLADADRIANAARLVLAAAGDDAVRSAVVVSAMAGVTDRLIDAARRTGISLPTVVSPSLL